MAEPNILAPGYVSMPGSNGNALYVPDPSPDYWTIPPEGLTMVFRLRRFNAWDDQNSARFLLATQMSSSTSGWDLRLTTTGALSVASFADDGAIQYAQAASLAQMTNNLPLGEWHEIAVTYTPNNGTQRRSRAFKRVDGAWVAIGGTTNPIITPAPPLRALAIGAGNMSGGNNIAGDLGYVAIYHGTDSDLTPYTSGDPIFEFDGTELSAPNVSAFVSKSGHTVTVTADPTTPLTITPRKATYQITPQPGYLQFHGVAGAYCSLSCPQIIGADIETIEMTARVRLADALPEPMHGWGSTHLQHTVATLGRLIVQVLGEISPVQFIGVTPSDPIPGFELGRDIWVRSTINIGDPVVLNYAYSFDDVIEVEDVEWVHLPDKVGLGAGLTPTTSASGSIHLGTVSSGLAGMTGRGYYFAERVNGTLRYEVRAHRDLVSTTATSFTPTVGTYSVIRRGSDGELGGANAPDAVLTVPEAYLNGKPVWGGYIDGEFVSEVAEDLLRGAAA